MKNIFLILSLITCYNFHAQDYTFDYKIKFKKKQFCLLNSKDPSYNIDVFNGSGSLWDNKEEKRIRYYFKYFEKNDQKQYMFTATVKLSSEDEFDISKITVEKLDENKYLIKCFENSKSNHLKLKITLKPFDTDLIHFYPLDVSHNIQNKITSALKEKLGSNYNYYISDYNITYRNGLKIHFSVKDVEQINLKIKIPQNKYF